MKKLIKLLFAITFVALFLGCIITLPDVVIENEITITHTGDLPILSMYLVPSTDYLITPTSVTYVSALDFYSGKYTDLLATRSTYLTKGGSITIDLNDHVGTSFKLISFEPEYIDLDESAYVTTITTAMGTASTFTGAVSILASEYNN